MSDKPIPYCQIKKCNKDFIDNGVYVCCWACTMECEDETNQCNTTLHDCAYLIED